MTRYQLLEGEHLEPDGIPGSDGAIKIKRGEFFDSSNDEYAAKWPEKFKKADDGGQGSVRTWNPERESLEQFTERMKALQTAPTSQPAKQAQTQQPYVADSGIMEVLGSMTVKELQAHAAEEEIDLKGATKKEDILRVISQHQPAHATMGV